MDDSDGPNYPEPPEDGWRCVSFERDGVEGTYGNVGIECPCCEYDWEENAQRVVHECARALNAEHEKPTEWRFKRPLAELLEQAEHHGMLLAEVAEDGTLVMSGNETRLKEGYARVRARMPDAKVGRVSEVEPRRAYDTRDLAVDHTGETYNLFEDNER